MSASPYGSIEQRCAIYEFWAHRGRAIECYSTLEQSQCSLLAVLSGMHESAAGTVFFKITASRSRSAILDKLFKKKFGDKFRPFWNSLINHFAYLDQRRNELVHWGVVVRLGDGPEKYSLTPPNFWEFNENSPEWKREDFVDFMNRCDVVGRTLNMFTFPMRVKELPPEVLPPEQDPLFQGPLEYPLPPDHRLARLPSMPIIPPPPWEA